MFRELKFGGVGSARFPIPKSNRERALAIMLFGLAVIIAPSIDPLRDFAMVSKGENAIGELVLVKPNSRNKAQNLAIYKFVILESNFFSATKPQKNDYKFAKTARIAWPKGEPQNARILGLYPNPIPIIALGLSIFGLGLFWYRKAKKEEKN